MKKELKYKLIKRAKKEIFNSDPSHDILHALRVLSLVIKIAKKEKGDLDILIPAALFHDVINYPKDNPKSKYDSEKSGNYTKKILLEYKHFPKNKINKVVEAIKYCSFSKNLIPKFLEAKILQDADGIEATGAISIMRTFSSAGCMKKQFYNYKDPFCKKRLQNDKKYALDLFYSRLLQIEHRLHTKTAKQIVKKRKAFLISFLNQLKIELDHTI